MRRSGESDSRIDSDYQFTAESDSGLDSGLDLPTHSIDHQIGDTPLVRAETLGEHVYGKNEAANPYSVKDRIAQEMIDTAERSGRLVPGGTIVGATSGNTGIGLAAVATDRGYDCHLMMPESMSRERRQLLAALGATIELTPADGGMTAARDRAREIVTTHENAVLAQQFSNPANPRAHRHTTGPEIWRDTRGEVDAIIAGVGTGGTITGIARYLTVDRNADVTIVGVEPAQSPTLTEVSDADHDIQGIGPGFTPENLESELLDEVRSVTDQQAKTTTRELARQEGLVLGVSSGAAGAAARAYSQDHPSELVVVILPDGGERYLSTGLFERKERSQSQ